MARLTKPAPVAPSRWERLGNRLTEWLYPRLCPITQLPLRPTEWALSEVGLLSLPQTPHFASPAANGLTAQLAGLPHLAGAAALWPFEDDPRIRTLIHRLKYDDRPAVGRRIGAFMAEVLIQRQAEPILAADAVVPVPLHPKKLRERGYNQAAAFGEGLANGLGIPLVAKALRRRRYTTSQTGLSREARQQNVAQAFEIGSSVPAHILLVDDVATTGATLISAAEVLVDAGVEQISVATMAQAGGG